MTYEAELWVCTAILAMTENRACVRHQYTEPGLDPPICEGRSETGFQAHMTGPMESFGTFEFQEEVAV